MLQILRIVLIATAIAGFHSKLALGGAASDIEDGRNLYMRYCASCHGSLADGRGPVAKRLKPPPTNLTRLSNKFGKPLPIRPIARFIAYDVRAHGTREMPAWGTKYGDIWISQESQQGAKPERIDKIILYLNSIQKASHPGELPPGPAGINAPR